ncbi:MAG: hypothetical protein HYR84_05705, partial [Planctomycetes bacterium]|nr:hypothetical protein [Planctomycetota bacterium]
MKEIARLVRYIAVLTKRLAYLRSLAAPGRADLEAIEWIEKELPAMQEALATLRAAAARAIVPEAVTAVAPEVAASVSLGFRVAVSVSLVLGIIVLLGMASYYGYHHYCRPETSPTGLGQGTDP